MGGDVTSPVNDTPPPPMKSEIHLIPSPLATGMGELPDDSSSSINNDKSLPCRTSKNASGDGIPVSVKNFIIDIIAKKLYNNKY